MTIRQSEGHTFIVRIRRQKPEGDAPQDDWHGEVVHVPTQQTASFRGLEALSSVIGRLLRRDA